MKRAKSRLGLIKQVKAEEPKKEIIEYKDLVEPTELIIADGIKLVFSVSKTSEGNPHMDIRTYIESEKYSGPTKKGINFDVEMLEDFLEIVNDMNTTLQGKGI